MTDPDDRKGQICTKCGAGDYQETSIHDDWDGVLHCTNKKCDHEVKRYKSKDDLPPKPTKSRLSFTARTVLDSIESRIDRCAALSVAFRVAANHLLETSPWQGHIESTGVNWSSNELFMIADELENQ
jgi:hypothetical protein